MNRNYTRRTFLKSLAGLPFGALLAGLLPSPMARAKAAMPNEVRIITPPQTRYRSPWAANPLLSANATGVSQHEP